MEQYILITGDPIDGLEFIGPFENADDAAKYAEGDKFIDRDTWWITTLVQPNE